MIADKVHQMLLRIKSLQPMTSTEVGLDAPFVYESKIIASPIISTDGIEKEFAIVLPPDLKGLWTQANSVRLFEEVNYGQSGLVIWSVEETLKQHPYYIALRGEPEFKAGDLIVGKFRGDSDLIVIRCNPDMADFGAIVIGLPIYSRDDWYVAATSLMDFFEKYIEASGEKYWEYHS